MRIKNSYVLRQVSSRGLQDPIGEIDTRIYGTTRNGFRDKQHSKTADSYKNRLGV